MRWALGLAWQRIRRHPDRVVAPTLVAAGATIAVVVTASLYLGIVDGTVGWLRTLPGDAVVAPAESNPVLIQSFVALRPDTVRAVRGVPGVGAVHELISKGAWLSHGDREAFVQLAGVRPDESFGAPVQSRAGRPRPRLGEIVLDVVAAADLDARIGDRVGVGNPGGRTVTLAVAGLSAGGNQVVGSQAFVSRASLALAGLADPTHLFVETAPGHDPAALRAALAAVPDVQVFAPAAFVERNLVLPRQVFRPILGGVAGLVTVIAALILGVVLRADSTARRGEYALLGALGVPSTQVAAVVVASVCLTAGIGVATGAATALVLGAVVPVFIPRLATTVPWWLVGGIGLGAITLSLVAAIRPARAVARTDPALVFRV